jgi:hypothetical protein
LQDVSVFIALSEFTVVRPRRRACTLFKKESVMSFIKLQSRLKVVVALAVTAWTAQAHAARV